MTLRKATATISNEENLSAQDVTAIKTTLELQNVDNTSDADKPVSTAQQTALNGKVDDNDARLTDERTPTDDSVSTSKLQDAAVTNSKLATIQTNRIKGRQSPGTGVVEDLQLSTVKNMLNLPNDTASDLTAVENTANGALQRSGGDMTGAITGDQSARLYRPQGGVVAGDVTLSALDKNSFFLIDAKTDTVTINISEFEPDTIREFLVVYANNTITITNQTGFIYVSGIGLINSSEFITVGNVGDAFTIRGLSGVQGYAIVGGEFTLVE